ncbi:hypothetical protein AJ79_02852 [Helicocarpus griseus UAMH5409]|uniref:Uncharacterized protein n=1 Tax=Helicocarpus griseus UAMH5409 TaxID=1447875 RepID=A0A2B7XZN9_9EURO|nr:hypothetical protein AJ79_02852 [Helicocarpus griseus UAMH5409]
MEFTDINISEVVFKEQLADRKFSMIFLVVLRGKTCVMVHHGQGTQDPLIDPVDLETNIYKCESNAYRRFKETGICEKGITPEFYGTPNSVYPI